MTNPCDDECSPQSDWLDADALEAMDYDESVIARLQVRTRGWGGRPCWHRDEIDDLVAMQLRQLNGGRTS